MQKLFNSRIGFMQGRLSPIVHGRIQSFPWGHWEQEFSTAKKIGLQKIEWTIDSKKIQINPIIIDTGRKLIMDLIKTEGVSVPSVTSDYFMENPPWSFGAKKVLDSHRSVCEGMQAIGAKLLIIPLVDNSSINSAIRKKDIIEFISKLGKPLEDHELRIAIESDYSPYKLASFISQFDPELVGINYDIGNSAGLGFNSAEEIEAYADRIINVHVKDRLLGGRTVPLGTGAADLPKTIYMLETSGYSGNYILQTARAIDQKHNEVIVKYATLMEEWLHANNV